MKERKKEQIILMFIILSPELQSSKHLTQEMKIESFYFRLTIKLMKVIAFHFSGQTSFTHCKFTCDFHSKVDRLRSDLCCISFCQKCQLQPQIPVMAAVAVRKKVVSIGHFSSSFCFQSLQIFLLVRSNQEHLHVLVALFIREIQD